VRAVASQGAKALAGGPLPKSSFDVVLLLIGGAVVLGLVVWAVVQPPRVTMRGRRM